MLSRHLLLSAISLLGLGAAFVGCGRSATTTQPESATEITATGDQASGQANDVEHGDHQGQHVHNSATHGHRHAGCCGDTRSTKGLADLSDEDRALAEKQKVCPVTGTALGSMGKPLKVIVKGRAIFLCCPGCEEELKKNPDIALKPHRDRQT